MFQKKFVQKIKTHYTFNNIFPRENHAVYEMMWKNMLQRNRSHMTV